MFWSKAPTPTDPPAAPATTPTPAPNAAPPPHPPPPAAAAPPLTRDQQADLDLEEILAELDRDHQTHAAAAKHNATTHFADDDKTGLPTDMNCLTAFDEMFYCYSLGGQFLNAYRYGGFRDCSEKSADWRFCIKTKVRGEVASRAMVLARNKEKAAKYKTGKSSEDVWSVRKEPLVDAFTGNVDDME